MSRPSAFAVLEIHHKLVLGWSLHRQVGRLLGASRPSPSKETAARPLRVTATVSSPIGESIVATATSTSPSRRPRRRSSQRARGTHALRRLQHASRFRSRSSACDQLPESFRPLVRVGPGGLLGALHELRDLAVWAVEHVAMDDGDARARESRTATTVGPLHRPAVGRRRVDRAPARRERSSSNGPMVIQCLRDAIVRIHRSSFDPSVSVG